MRQGMALFLIAAAWGAGCRTEAIQNGGDDVPSSDVQVADAVAADAVDVITAPDLPVVSDAGTPGDVPVAVDARDVGVVATGIAAVRAAIGTATNPVTISVALADLVVTRTLSATPAVDGGVSMNDPAGFFVQAGMTGPAIFVAVDPMTLSPVPVAGDRVSFTATQGRSSGGARWITGVSNFARSAQGVDLATLRQDLSAATDLVTGLGEYEHEFVRVQGTVATTFTTAGTGFESAQVTTAGISAAMTNLRLRVAAPLRMSLGLRVGCTFAVTAPLWRFNTQVQVHAWEMGDIADVTCPPVMDAGATDAGATDAGATDAGATDVGATDVRATDVGLTATDVPGVDAGTEATPTAVWVVRVGDGMAALTNQATAVFLERVRLADGMSDGVPIALPTTAMGANQAFSISGSSTGDGQVTRTVDRRSVVLAGYAVAPGSTDAGVADGRAPRVVARVSADGTVNTSTTLGTAFSGGNARGATSVDGSYFWAFGESTNTGGLVGAALGAMASVPVITTPANVRFAAIYDGALYGTISQSGGYGVFRVTGTTGTQLPGFPTTGSPAPDRFGFVAFDRDATPGIDTIYQCDGGSTATTSGGGVWKYTLANDGTWTNVGRYTTGLTTGCRGITGYVDGANVNLFVVTATTTTSQLLRTVDTGAAPAMTTFTMLRQAPMNTLYRGVVLAPR